MLYFNKFHCNALKKIGIKDIFFKSKGSRNGGSIKSTETRIDDKAIKVWNGGGLDLKKKFNTSL